MRTFKSKKLSKKVSNISQSDLMCVKTAECTQYNPNDETKLGKEKYINQVEKRIIL